jgi:hypothetical protein
MTPQKEIALHRYIDEQIGKPFKFGKHDCLLIALGALDVLTDTEHREAWTGRWTSKKTAYEYAAENNTSIKQILMDAGCKEVDVRFLHTGDFVLTETDPDYSKGFRSATVYLGGGRVAAVNKDGVSVVKLEQLVGIKEALRW